MRGPKLYAGVAVLSGLTLLLPAAPGYDPLAWLVWGREVAHLSLDTSSGPSWKPLPVAVAALLAPLGSLAAPAWLWIARAAALLAVVVAARLAARLAPPGHRVVAAVGAALTLVLTGGFLGGAARGYSEGMLIALTLLALEAHLDGRRGRALAFGTGAALLRPEVWPFLLVYAVWLWRRDPALRKATVGAAAAVLALWFLPELWGSGELLRSSNRARIPNPGSPAAADVPALAVLSNFAAILALPLALAALAALRGRLLLALGAAAAAWVLLVAVMAQAGWAGEARYLLAAAGPLAVVAGVGLARLADALPEPRWIASAGAAALLLVTIGLYVPDARRTADAARYAAGLHRDLEAAVDAAGGAERIQACGPHAAGRYRFPAVAWRTGLHISDLELVPQGEGIVFRSRLTRGSTREPEVPAGYERVAAAGQWEIYAACAGEAR